MAFNTIEYLENGNVDFIYTITDYDIKSLIQYVRGRSDRLDIIKGFINKLKKDKPRFCFEIIYDVPEYNDLAYELLINEIGIDNLTKEQLRSILKNMPYGLLLITDHLDELLNINNDRETLISFLLTNYNEFKDIVHKISRHKNMKIRFFFMKILVRDFKELINEVYDDITKYLSNYTYEKYEQISLFPLLMDVKDVSELAMLFLKNGDMEVYKRLKEMILSLYNYNSLASSLDKYDEIPDDKHSYHLERNPERVKELTSDIDRLFKTSIDYRLQLYLNYSSKISKELIEDFVRRVQFFQIGEAGFLETGYSSQLYNVYSRGLGIKLERYVDKYLGISKRKDYEHIGKGSTGDCYRIGDYVFKLFSTKWSYEDVICPNSFLIVKDYEEDYCRDERGIVIAGLEVQKYLPLSARDIDKKYFTMFLQELDKQGYFMTDTLINGTCGDNTRLLDSYQDADCYNPEMLPDWFKKCPLVLVDRDRVYEKGKGRIKQLSSGY
jgi:hypothetical protein